MSEFSVVLKTALCWIAIISCRPVLADIFFIDVNNAHNEVEAARRQAKQRKEKLIIFPSFTAEEKAALNNLGSQTYETWSKFDELKCFKEGVCNEKSTSSFCKDIQTRLDSLAAEEQKILQSKLSKEKLSEALEQASNGGHITSLIVSGEDGGSVFGVNGELSWDDITAAISENPKLQQDVQSLYLWGCYMSTSGKLNSYWTRLLPNAKFIAGFYDSAPANSSPPGIKLLEDLLSREGLAHQAQSKEAIASFFDGTIARRMNTSMCINGHYKDPKNSFAMSEIDVKGQSCIDRFPKELHEKYECYIKGEVGCESPPPNTKESDLRGYYNWLQANEICLTNEKFLERFPTAGDIQSTLRLIFWKNIWNNFVRNHSKDLQAFNSFLKATGFGDDRALSADLSSMSRADVLNFIKTSGEKLTALERNPSLANLSALQDAREFHYQFYNAFSELSEWIVPTGWIIPESTKRSDRLEFIFDCQV